MEDETITGDVDQAEGATAQPEATTEAAENDQTGIQPDQSEAQTTNDDDLTWAQKKGVDLEDKAKVAAMLRNADRKVSEAGLAKTQLNKEVGNTLKPTDGSDPVAALEAKYIALEHKAAANDYYLNNPEDKQLDEVAVSILKEEAENDLEFAQALARNLPKLFALARQKHSEDSVAQAQDQARKEERAALAGKQRASATSSAASNSAPTSKTEESARLERFSTW